MNFGYFCNTTNWNKKPYTKLLEEAREIAIYCDQNNLHDLNEKIINTFGKTKSTELIWKSDNTINLEKNSAEKLFKLLNTLEYSNNCLLVFISSIEAIF